MGCITGKYYWMLVVGCWLLTACSSDHSEESEGSEGSTLKIVPYAAAYKSNNALSRRAVSAGYSEYNPTSDLAIGLLVLPSGTTQSNDVKLFRYSSGKWHSQAKVVSGNSYRVYGYMPKKDPIVMTVTEKGNGEVDLVFTGIDAVMLDDICFVAGVKNMEGNLYQGQFGYVAQPENNWIRVLMDHLFAAIKFDIKVEAKYNALRTIKLRSLKLNTTALQRITLTLTPNGNDVDPVYNIEYTPKEGTATATLFEDETGLELDENVSATVSDCFGYFVSQQSNALTLVCTYDVYDKKGNLIRKDCRAENKLPNLAANRGQFVTIKLTVAPTYLYQLSEPDLDNPSITIEN